MAKKYITALITLILILSPLVGAKYVGGSSYNVFTGNKDVEEVDKFKPGETLYIWLRNTLEIGVNLSIEIEISDPEGKIASSRTVDVEVPPNGLAQLYMWSIPEVAPTGKWSVHVVLKDLTFNREYRDVIYFEVVEKAPPPPPPPSPAIPSWAILAVGVVIAVALVSIAYYISTKRRPREVIPPEAKPPTPPPSPPPTPTPREGETIALPEAPVPAAEAETVVAMARLVAPDGTIIPITGTRQSFGREDFQNLVPPDKARLISRRAKPQFTIFYDFGTGQFYIEDNNSANGTLLNGKQIKGQGPQPLKDGDTISPAGVVELKFSLSKS